MKKIFYLLLMIFSFSLLVGCNLEKPDNDEKTEEVELEKLEKPVVTIDEDGLASWKKVKNAEGYAYIINDGKEKNTSKTSVQLELGDSIKVKALGDGEEYEDSSYSKKVIYNWIDLLRD